MVVDRQLIIDYTPNKKVFFISDLHLGAPTPEKSKHREKKFLSWLDEVKDQAAAIFILGDLFDFWFEYKQVVPKGFVRTLGALASLTDNKIPVYFFCGNHDLWVDDYLEKEVGLHVYHHRENAEIFNHKFLIGHGDGLGPGDKGYKRMKKVFTHPLPRRLFGILHPDIGIWLGNKLSQNNKLITGEEDVKFLGDENEWLVNYARKKIKNTPYDYFVFGHRHLPLEIKIDKQATYINLGDWIKYYTYGVFDGKDFKLLTYQTSL